MPTLSGVFYSDAIHESAVQAPEQFSPGFRPAAEVPPDLIFMAGANERLRVQTTVRS